MDKNIRARIHKGKEIVSKGLETLFLVLTGVYLLYLMQGTTTFYLPFPWWFDKALLRTLAGVTVLRLALLGPRRREPWLSVAMAAVYYLAFRSTGYRFLVYLGVLTAGCSGIDYRKVLRTYLLATGAFFLATVIAALAGAITHFVYASPGKGIRSSWGFCYPTDFASIALFIALMLSVAWQKLPDWAALLLCAVPVLLARFIACSDTSLICGLLFAGLILFDRFERRVVARHPRLRRFQRGTDWLLTLAFPICACAMFALMVVYRRHLGIGLWANHLLTDRLSLAVNAWKEHGLKAFGTLFEQIGNGFSTVHNGNYNFIDSTYPLILIRYGWAPLLALGILWSWTTYRAIRCGDRRLALAMALIAFHSFSEHHFIEVNYNILLVMPFALYPQRRQAEKAPERKPSKAWIVTLATCAVAGALLCLGLPGLLPWLKTIFQIKGLCGGGQNGWRVICVNLGIVAVGAAVIWSANRIVESLVHPGRARRRALAVAALAACAGIIGAGLAHGERLIARAQERASDLLEADRPALEIIADASSGPVYSNILPEVYSRACPGVGRPVFSGEELARYRGGTLLMDSGEEYQALIGSGFLYARISQEHAVYTDDRAVAQALKDRGYSVTGYYSEAKDVDLLYEARLNSLDYSPETGLALDGPLQSLTMGPYVDLYDGRYAVTYDMKLQEGASEEVDAVCRLQVSGTWGENSLAEQVVRRNQFDERGALSISLPFSVNNGRGIEFLAFNEDAAPVHVERIRYARLYDYDTHTQYDDRLRVVRREYYTLDGAPMTTTGGYFAFENRYDWRGNISEAWYFDVHNQPVVTAYGYAGIHRVFNRIRKVVLEEYYGTDGSLSALASGQAAEQRDYDRYGNITRRRYLDANGEPVVINSGYAELRCVYDDRNQNVREDYFDAEGRPAVLATGQTSLERAYDEAGNATEYRYYDMDHRLIEIDAGYAILRRTFNGDNQVTGEAFFDSQDQPASVSPVGYSRIEYQYDDGRQLALVTYFDREGNRLQAGSGYMHEYLQSLIGKDYTVFIAVQDEGTESLTTALLQDLRQLGVQTDLKGKHRNSFYAVAARGQAVEELSATSAVSREGDLDGTPYAIASASFNTGNYSSIVIDGVEYSRKARGLNMVVFDNASRQVVDAVAFDTYSQLMTVTR